MAYAFAERERTERGATDQIDLLTGGTRPASHVHEGVVTVMQEHDIDLGDQCPREITFDELQDVDLVVTMGCSASDVCPATWDGDTRDWALDDPYGRPLAEVRAIRDEIEHRVSALFDELLEDVNSGHTE